MRQGPHQGAQKSTTTGSSDFNTTFSNSVSLTCTGSFILISISRIFDDFRYLIFGLFCPIDNCLPAATQGFLGGHPCGRTLAGGYHYLLDVLA